MRVCRLLRADTFKCQRMPLTPTLRSQTLPRFPRITSRDDVADQVPNQLINLEDRIAPEVSLGGTIARFD